MPSILDAESQLLRALAEQHPEWTDSGGVCLPCTEAAHRWAIDEFPVNAVTDVTAH